MIIMKLLVNKSCHWHYFAGTLHIWSQTSQVTYITIVHPYNEVKIFKILRRHTATPVI